MADCDSCERYSIDLAMIVVDFLADGNENFPRDNEPSQESTGSSDILRSRMSMKLLSPGFGKVGVGNVVEVHPVGQWLESTFPSDQRNSYYFNRPT